MALQIFSKKKKRKKEMNEFFLTKSGMYMVRNI